MLNPWGSQNHLLSWQVNLLIQMKFYDCFRYAFQVLGKCSAEIKD